MSCRGNSGRHPSIPCSAGLPAPVHAHRATRHLPTAAISRPSLRVPPRSRWWVADPPKRLRTSRHQGEGLAAAPSHPSANAMARSPLPPSTTESIGRKPAEVNLGRQAHALGSDPRRWERASPQLLPLSMRPPPRGPAAPSPPAIQPPSRERDIAVSPERTRTWVSPETFKRRVSWVLRTHTKGSSAPEAVESRP